MEEWIVWLIVIGVLLIVEVLSQMMWALCLAAGCIVGLLLSACGLGLTWQIIGMAAGSVSAYIFLVPLFQKWHALSVDRKGREARTGMDALLGRRSRLSHEITPSKPGRGRIDGDNWQMCASEADESISAGTEVEVVGYDSIILFVKPVNNK